MSHAPPSSDPPLPPLQPAKSGVRTVLEASGVPASWFKRPKLPSRNWMIFWTATSSLVGLYIYDRQQCQKIRADYVNRVQELSSAPLHSLDLPRKVTVYGAKWPGDDDSDRGLRHFRKYVKPMLVAAAVDYEMVSGKRHGDLADHVASDIIKRRRAMLGLDQTFAPPMPTPVQFSAEELRRRELEGGVVIVGRHTLKEFMAGLSRGWSLPPQIRDKEEDLARVLEDDGHFDEHEPEIINEDSITTLAGEPLPTRSRLPPSRAFASLSPMMPPISSPDRSHSNSPPDVPIPNSIPPLPPLLLVSYKAHFGFTQIPLMIKDFFYERAKVRVGAEEGYRLVKAVHRPFCPPHCDSDVVGEKVSDNQGVAGDLSFDSDVEKYYPKWARSIPEDIAKARGEYYKSLPQKLDTARALARGTREATKEERDYPPPTEVELRAERMKKELRWRNDLEGWNIVRSETGVVWDDRFQSSLDVYIDPHIEGDAVDTP